jgi:hypothetical protein
MVGGTQWLAEQRQVIQAPAEDWVARQRLAMPVRILPVIEPLPPMTPMAPPANLPAPTPVPVVHRSIVMMPGAMPGTLRTQRR